MRNLIKLFLLFIVISTGLVVRAEIGKVYELDFKGGQTFYVYADTKSTIRLKGVPSHVDVIQGQVLPDTSGNLRANILGKRNKIVEHGSGLADYIDFNIQVSPEASGHPSKDPIVLKFKSFRKLESDSYEVISNTSNYIRTKQCTGNDPSCGLIKVKCRPHSTNCIDGQEEIFTTYPNECAVDRAGAKLYHRGACRD